MDTLRIALEAQKGVSQILTPLLDALNYSPATNANTQSAALNAGQTLTAGPAKVLLVAADTPVNVQADTMQLTNVRHLLLDQPITSLVVTAKTDGTNVQVLTIA